MTTITKENRAAIQSVRAKARKAANVTGAEIPASVSKHLDAVIAWADSALKVSPIKVPVKSKAGKRVGVKAPAKAKAAKAA